MYSKCVPNYIPNFRFNKYPWQNTFSKLLEHFFYSGGYLEHILVHINITETLFLKQSVTSKFSMGAGNLQRTKLSINLDQVFSNLRGK